jgi:8-oxo-dGTP pyrophosphatase MutT (NUDIX family)
MIEAIDRISPRTGQRHSFEYLRLDTWVNIIALTTKHHIVLVRQYRHGIDEVVTELPAGTVDLGEDERDAAVRELLEETGYQGRAIRCLGSLLPNPAIQTNTLSTWLVTDAERVREASLDASEHIDVVEIPLPAVKDYIRTGGIRSAFSIAAFYLLSLDPAFGAVVLGVGNQASSRESDS